MSMDIVHERSDIGKRASLSECASHRGDYFLSLAKTTEIRTMHEFRVQFNRSIEYRRTSSSLLSNSISFDMNILAFSSFQSNSLWFLFCFFANS